MISEAFEWLKKNITRPHTFEAAGLVFVDKNGYEAYDETVLAVWSRNPNGGRLHLGTVQSLIDLVRWWLQTEAELGSSVIVRITVSPGGVWAVFGVDADVEIPADSFENQTNAVYVPFTKKCPPEQHFSYEKLLMFLDDHSGNIIAEDDLRRSIAKLTVVSKDEVQVKDMGAFTTFIAKTGRDVQDSEFRIPKEIAISMETGTREFMLVNNFILRVKLEGPSFTLIRKTTDQLDSRLVAMALEVLRQLPSERCLILEAP